MTPEQGALFALMGVIFALLVWGRFRFDLVAFGALFVAVALGLVEEDAAFEGFGHAAVVVIALVFVVSRGLLNSGAIEVLASKIIKADRPLAWHIGIMAGVGAALSAVINNVAALALLMTLDLQTAGKAKRSPALTLMPLSFATILGGMITLIGTPPNIVIAQFRENALGESYGMFDFAPVGLVVASAGVAFTAFIGWRLIPIRGEGQGVTPEGAEAALYIAEARAPEGAKPVGETLSDLAPLAEEHDVTLLGLVRGDRRLPGFARRETVQEGDVLLLEGDPKAIETFMGACDLDHPSETHEKPLSGRQTLVEAIVPDGARIAGRSAAGLRLMERQGAVLLGISRQGRRSRDRVRRQQLRAGDVVLLLGPRERMPDVMTWLGVLPLEGRATPVLQRHKTAFAVLAFLVAVGASVAGWLSLPIALAGCVAAYALAGVVDGREVYESVEWKAIVLLACLVPIAGALEESGGTALIAQNIVGLTDGWPPLAILMVLMLVTMTLSDFLNNVATALIAAPIGLGIARAIEAPPDPFLMGVAVAASCAFLTPIGHKNNTIIMGPGGYRFGDYWRMGLPLELLVLAVAGPTIWWVWG